ncbi:MAG: carbon-nitrogen hydrolase family protein [Sphingomonadales bacterium]|jgi:predicted amidohydrolase
MQKDQIRLAIVQAAPIALNITAGLESAAQHAKQAAGNGATVIAFGETWLGGYPIWLDSAPSAAIWDQKGTKELHRILLEQGVYEGDPRLSILQKISDETGAYIIIGAHEKRRSSLYNAQIFFAPQQKPYFRRKLTPTHGERLIWSRGDGSTLSTIETEFGALGGLICWEHWMPLARAHMHHQAELVHVAQWPTVRESYLIASQHYAFEGRCFVMAAGTIYHKSDLLEGLDSLDGGFDAAYALLNSIEDEQLQFGGSAIIRPDAKCLAGPLGDQSEILYADINLGQIREELAALDTDGHYSRPDVFELHVDTRAKNGVKRI